MPTKPAKSHQSQQHHPSNRVRGLEIKCKIARRRKVIHKPSFTQSSLFINTLYQLSLQKNTINLAIPRSPTPTMRFQLTNLLALIPFVAGIALPAPSTDAQSLSDLAHYEIHTTADGVTCLGIYLYYDTYYGPNDAGLPGCGVELWNRVSLSLPPSLPVSRYYHSVDSARKIVEEKLGG